MEIIDHIAKCSFLAAPPCRDRWHQKLLTEDVSTKTRQKGVERRALDKSAAQRVSQRDGAGAHRPEEAGHTEQRIIAQLKGIAIVVIHPAQDHIDLTKSFQSLDEDPALSDDKILPLHKRAAQLPGEVGLLEIRFIERAGRQENSIWLNA